MAIRRFAAVFFFILSAGCATGTTSSEEAESLPVKEHVVGYRSIGRVKWRVPENAGFYFAVPHFTAGSRLKCQFPSGGGECEIGVYPRDLTKDAKSRRDEYFGEMESLLPAAVEKSVEVRSFGSGASVYYATLTDKRGNNGHRYLTRGLFVKGTFVIRFDYLTNDASGTELKRVLRVVHSADPIDATTFLAWKLSDYKSVCEDQFPTLKAINDAAFAKSPFASVDWKDLMMVAYPGTTKEKAAAEFEQARLGLLADFQRGPFEEWERFCRAYPRQVEEAQRN